MKLSPKQIAILSSLYKRYKETGRCDRFVSAKGVTSSTMKSLYKTGCIDSDRVLQDIPANMTLNEHGINVMEEYYKSRKLTSEKILNRNKQFMRFVQNTEEKRLILLNYLQPSPMIKSDIDVIHRGYGIFEAINVGKDEQYYGVYDLTEGNAVEVGGCDCNSMMWAHLNVNCNRSMDITQ